MSLKLPFQRVPLPHTTPSTVPPIVAGAARDAEGAITRIVPWVASVGLHTGLILLGFLISWTVMRVSDDEAPVRVTADFESLYYDPLQRLPTDSFAEAEPLPRAKVAAERTAQTLSREPGDAVEAPLSLISDALEPLDAGFDTSAPGESATFVGIRSTNARRIVYVIDASGSMIRSLKIVLGELARSLDALAESQSFGIIFFQGDEALMVPPTNRLVAATEQATIEALQWIQRRVIPSGRSNPLAAIEMSLGLRPDVIFLLSENITGSGPFEIDQEDLLGLLEKLNPADPRTGRRATRINCVQFLYPDPLDTLKKIAQRHGGPKGYKFLDADELGIVAP